MRLLQLLCALLVASLALAGCMSDDGDDGGPEPTPTPSTPPQPPEDPLAEGSGHFHGDPAQHQFLWHYAFASRDPILSNPANAAGLHAMDLAGDHLFGALYGSHVGAVDGGLAVWDLADPLQPRLTGRVALPGAVGGDRSIEATDDGEFVVLATEPITCFGQLGTNPADAYLIDVRDKANPRIADALTILGPSLGGVGIAPGLGIHSVVVHRYGDTDYAFLMGRVYEIVRGGPSGATLVDTGASLPVGHDLYVRDTPWGSVWGLSANGGTNFQIFDLTDPTAPQEIAIFEGADGHYLHTADAHFFEDGQAVVILTTEDWTDVQSVMWVFDATALRDHDAGGEPLVLEPAHTYTTPGNHTAAGLSFSMHNPRFGDDGILDLSHYHGGLWQLDFRAPENRLHPVPIAYAVYAEGTPPLAKDPQQDAVERNLCGLGAGLDTPTYMDVERGPNGVLYAADVYMGLYTFAPTAEHPVYGGMVAAP